MINRMRMPLMRYVSLLALFLIVAGSGQAAQRERDVRKQTALDRYVYKPDSNYGYKLVNTSKGEGYTAYVLELTSQQWRTAEEVDRPIWKHWLTIISAGQGGDGDRFPVHQRRLERQQDAGKRRCILSRYGGWYTGGGRRSAHGSE